MPVLMAQLIFLDEHGWTNNDAFTLLTLSGEYGRRRWIHEESSMLLSMALIIFG